ncbi:phosphotransferase-like protein [Phycicoccus endophyticus]|uniref:phosphotransferase-like protein n=1 Tax=Phycicoccus endophyticus TaxID=1690220 RepID=UPI001407D30B|nr:hypothetical protein [Phycicoccus endophyticus]NHI20441.1 hypothetical protein [Phycicoccus endophyticus]
MPPHPLLLTGGPAAGKTTTARALADGLPRAACIEVDDLRQLVRSGAAAPWEGSEGRARQALGAENAALLAQRFDQAGFAVVVTDVVTRRTLELYRRILPGIAVVRLVVTETEARRRAAGRPLLLTPREFAWLHRDQREPLAVDHELDVTTLGVEEQVRAVRRIWGGRARLTPGSRARRVPRRVPVSGCGGGVRWCGWRRAGRAR